MKHLLLFILLILFSSSSAFADQCDLMSLEKAEAASAYFLKNKDVVLWCACCDNDEKSYIRVQKAYPHEAYDDAYEVVLEGLDAQGQEQITTVDLAYVHVIRNGKAICAGSELKCNPDLDPCTEPFSFQVPEVKVPEAPEWNFGEMEVTPNRPQPKPYESLSFPPSSEKPDRSIAVAGKWATHVRFSADDERILVGGGYFDDETTLQVFNTASLKEERKLTGLTGMVIAMDVSPTADLIAASDTKGKVIVWDFITGEKKYELTEHNDWVEGLAFCRDGKYFATAGRDKKVCVWETATGKLLRRFTVKMESAASVAFYMYNQFLAVGGVSPADEIKMINLVTGEEHYSLDLISRWCKDLAVSPDQRYLFAATDCDNSALIIQALTGDLNWTMQSYGGCTEAVDIDASGQYYAMAGMWGITVWDVESGESVFFAKTHAFPVEDVAFSHKGKWLATAARGSEVHLWKLGQ